MPPSVLFIADHLNTGGAPVVIRDLCVALRHVGAEVTLVVLSDRVTHTLPDSVQIHRLPYSPAGRWQRLHRYANHAKQLDRLLNDIDLSHDTLVVAHLHHAHQVVSRSSVSQRAWYCLHADPDIGFLGKKTGLDRWRKCRKVHRLYNGKRLIGVSHGILESLSRVFNVQGTPGVGLHNPLDLKAITETSQQVVDDVPDDYLLYVGRLDQRPKRFDRLLSAYKESGTTLPLVIIGKGSAQQFIEREVERLGLQGRVILLGHRASPYAYMRQARALLLSSDYEGFSLVLAEALACGTPCVSTDCPSGPREILTEELSRFLVPMGDVTAFAQAINDVVETPPNVGVANVAHLEAEQVAQRYLKLQGAQD
ncbi:glycosyltransferase [Chromohalobacter sp. HP20-39]|uniref:glycosyltransferase n=1 Tax=Chromohalobacter sp. HP20-39 TaxID=3079306 RepID=UPI00294AACB4|nr:glycosyltransferase [Chromohalobacter sp. HP20-39]MDV6320542.1 glycosyltransferase [Chromohalobacter sp. HP20-39]